MLLWSRHKDAFQLPTVDPKNRITGFRDYILTLIHTTSSNLHEPAGNAQQFFPCFFFQSVTAIPGIVSSSPQLFVVIFSDALPSGYD